MLEKMDEFFENRIDTYDEHMMTNIQSANEFYPYTAKQLPQNENVHILDLGCGTGLEIGEYFKVNPCAKVTGIDMSEGMLDVMRSKFPEKDLILVCDSYFDADFGKNVFDGAVSVESLHHYTKEEKISLYKKLYASLKNDSCFILTDYFSLSDEEELQHFETLKLLKTEQGIADSEIYHYDTPLTVQHEIEALVTGGFSSVEILKNWGATYTLKAKR